MTDLVSQAAAADFAARAVWPARELGAYEALWARRGASFKSLARRFRAQPDALPSELIGRAPAHACGRAALERLRAAGMSDFGLRVHGTGEYPRRLRDAAHPVEVLYFRGNWDLVSTRCVAVVGTRLPSERGLRHAEEMARGLVHAGFTVVAGLARGIDTAAHRAAMAAGGRTIAVLGTPLDECYPPENCALQGCIAAEHLLVSQVPILGYAGRSAAETRGFFAERNATMAALCEAAIIVEAGDRSGTLILARHALEQGRTLFILDDCCRNSALTWAGKFLELGAIRVRGFEDVRARLESVETDRD